ncbi:hypothetical protein H634G_10112 [Metarhizium anisopliae BRIP 53293]|uniref:Rhodopsin domain-containing protein n=1 Tax=Metarhizium anisopliae BRIP 53293 TaxID=1291518 RepID=A0A0D9NLG4_METAN|nr:hypothetical protein H634G_10112 [Metarhizium anisopliae BRIP 53293]KJK94963.1 hypothetical protein H633G_01189 [Metarhizium anisopliae BRIP 53284]
MDGLDYTKVPLGVPPPGQQSNLLDAESQAWIPRLAIYTTLPVALCFIIMRIGTRIRMKHSLGWDDYLSILSGVGHSMLMLRRLLLDDMYGRHFWDIPVSAATSELMKETCAITAMYDVSAALTKVSLLALFLRIFARSRRSKMMIWAGIGFTVASYATLLGAWIYYSAPHQGEGWSDPIYRVRTGRDTPAISVVFGALAIFTDFYIIAIPITAISSLNLSTKKKFGVSALFVTGLLACAFSVAGLSPRIENYRQTMVHGTPDPFWVSCPSYGLAVAEINLGIVCACVPVIVPLLKGLLTQLSVTTSSWRRYWGARSKGSTDTRNLEAGKGSPAPDPNHVGRRWLSLNLGSQKPRGTPSSGTITVTQATEIHMVPYSELRSIDMDYHRYLGNGKNGSHAASAERGRAG